MQVENDLTSAFLLSSDLENDPPPADMTRSKRKNDKKKLMAVIMYNEKNKPKGNEMSNLFASKSGKGKKK